MILFGGSVRLSEITHLGDRKTESQTEHWAQIQRLLLLLYVPLGFLTLEVPSQD